ncbi:M20/M25/M40 family metallo-hydrolase [candidate division WOR-3 bacterium]|nr:M20/M25/M40 family metallo-hydrolase [candidate division WOR-3 bacterium]
MQKNEAWQRFVFVSVFFCSLIYSQPIEYLVKTNTDVVNNISVIELIDEQALLVADEGVLQEFKQAGIHYVVLDKNPRDNFYLFVFPVAEDLTSISRFGTILDQYDECVLLRTTRDQIPELNKLKVELSRLTLKPIVKRDASFYDFENIDVTRDTLIQQMLDDVEPDSILESVLRLQHFYTRYSMSDSNKIAVVNWIRDKLDAYGCDSVYTQNFSNNYGDNVVGIERGKRFPSTQKYVLIGGHLDDVPSFGYAPGADDNASGTVAMLEAARVLKDYKFAHTIRFAAFNAEEQGLIGSDSLAAFANSQDDTLIAALCYDMIGYVTAPGLDSMRLRYTSAVPGCSVFARVFYQAVADTYTQLKIRHVRYTGTTGSSDHASFWKHGYVSTGGIERVLCPGYHTIGDTVGPTGFNNVDFAAEVIKTAIAVLATLAVPGYGVAVDEQLYEGDALLFLVRPNPARDFTVSFAVEKDEERIDLTVYDCIGRTVVSLANGQHRNGIYSVRWDGQDSHGRAVTPGVYFVALARDNIQQYRKIILVE